MEKIKISVIIPSYNVQKYIENCLVSITQQSYRNIEIIVIDDVSSDGTKDIIKRLEAKDQRIKFIELLENQGPAVARQVAIDTCTGDYLTFVDADDWYRVNDAIKIVVDAINHTKVDCVMFDYRTAHKSELFINKHFNGRHGLYSNAEAVIQKYTHPSSHWHYLWNKFYNVKVIQENNIRFRDDLRSAEDVWFNADFLRCSKNVYILNKCYLYEYNRTNINQITRLCEIHRTLETERGYYEYLKNELQRLLEDCYAVGVYQKTYYSIYKQFFSKVTVMLMNSKSSNWYEKLEKIVFNDLNFQESKKILSLGALRIVCELRIQRIMLRVKNIIKMKILEKRQIT